MNRKLFLSLALFLSTFLCIAQETHEHNHNKHEIGTSISPVWHSNESGAELGLHVHYVYTFPHSKFGVVGSYERIFDEHKHNFIGIGASYRPIPRLSFSFSPGVAFEGEDKDHKEFAMHMETVYEFELGFLHLGPMLEAAYHPEAWHFSAGIHLGVAW